MGIARPTANAAGLPGTAFQPRCRPGSSAPRPGCSRSSARASGNASHQKTGEPEESVQQHRAEDVGQNIPPEAGRVDAIGGGIPQAFGCDDPKTYMAEDADNGRSPIVLLRQYPVFVLLYCYSTDAAGATSMMLPRPWSHGCGSRRGEVNY